MNYEEYEKLFNEEVNKVPLLKRSRLSRVDIFKLGMKLAERKLKESGSYIKEEKSNLKNRNK